MLERRAHPRRSVNKRGLLSFEDNRNFRSCRLVNISEGGVLVKISDAEEIPNIVSLYYDMLDEQRLEVVVAWCMVVRRGAEEAALRFLHKGSVDRLPAGGDVGPPVPG